MQSHVPQRPQFKRQYDFFDVWTTYNVPGQSGSGAARVADKEQKDFDDKLRSSFHYDVYLRGGKVTVSDAKGGWKSLSNALECKEYEFFNKFPHASNSTPQFQTFDGVKRFAQDTFFSALDKKLTDDDKHELIIALCNHLHQGGLMMQPLASINVKLAKCNTDEIDQNNNYGNGKGRYTEINERRCMRFIPTSTGVKFLIEYAFKDNNDAGSGVCLQGQTYGSFVIDPLTHSVKIVPGPIHVTVYDQELDNRLNLKSCDRLLVCSKAPDIFEPNRIYLIKKSAEAAWQIAFIAHGEKIRYTVSSDSQLYPLIHNKSQAEIEGVLGDVLNKDRYPLITATHPYKAALKKVTGKIRPWERLCGLFFGTLGLIGGLFLGGPLGALGGFVAGSLLGVKIGDKIYQRQAKRLMTEELAELSVTPVQRRENARIQRKLKIKAASAKCVTEIINQSLPNSQEIDWKSEPVHKKVSEKLLELHVTEGEIEEIGALLSDCKAFGLVREAVKKFLREEGRIDDLITDLRKDPFKPEPVNNPSGITAGTGTGADLLRRSSSPS